MKSVNVKPTISVLLSVIVVFALCPLTAFADSEDSKLPDETTPGVEAQEEDVDFEQNFSGEYQAENQNDFESNDSLRYGGDAQADDSPYDAGGMSGADWQSDGVVNSGQSFESVDFEQRISKDDLDVNGAGIVSSPVNIGVFVPEDSNRIDRPSTSRTGGVPSVSYSTHVQTYGWQDPVENGASSGTIGEAKRLEGIKIDMDGVEGLGVAYRTHVQKLGWQDPVANGEVSGTSGQALRLEAIQIALIGPAASNYDIYYRVHTQRYGWLDWASNGYTAGTSGYGYRLEAIEIKVLPKGAEAPGAVTLPYLDGAYGSGAINYKTHVQTHGWQDWAWDGTLSGTSGEAKRLEGIRINTQWMDELGVTYRTHVQKIGWQDWVSNGELSGTEGQGLRLEAIQIKLTGENADKYDVYYRVHTQKYGWLGWAKNGESAGTSCHTFRLEQIQIALTSKDYGEPTPSYGLPAAIEAYSTAEGQAMYNMNAWRSQYGLSAVTGNALLHKCAEIRSKELTVLFEHNRPNGSPCFTVSDEVGCDVPIYGENIAYGFSDGYSVVNAWMASSGHRANILNEGCRYVGIEATDLYWAQMLAGG